MRAVYMRKIYLLAFMLFTTLILGCEKSKVQVPSYIQIEEITLASNILTEGSNSSKFTDAWVTVNGKSYGTFELPAKFPVQVTGSAKIGVSPGIKINGAVASRESPLIFSSYVIDTSLVEASVIKVKPVVTYSSNAKFPWLENFETNGFTISNYGSSKNIISTSSHSKVFEGNKCGIFALTDSSDSYSVMSTNKYTLPKTGTSIYLELNYSCSSTLVIGLVANYLAQSSLPKQIIYLTATTTDAYKPKWNKIYISLTKGISEDQQAIDYNILFSCNKRDGISYDEVLIDNIKIVY